MLRLLLFLLLAASLNSTHYARAQSVVAVPPSLTDRRLTDADSHRVMLPVGPPRQQLLVYMVGTFCTVRSSLEVPKLAARLGYHVICLDYNNHFAAGQLVEKSRHKALFYDRFRHELVTGDNVLPEADLRAHDAIIPRLTTLLAYLQRTQPGQGWDQYLIKNEIQWQHLALAGHSQGASHAAWMAKHYVVARVIMAGGPLDHWKTSSGQEKNPAWVNQKSQTPLNRWFWLGHIDDEFGYHRMQRVAQALGVRGWSTPLEITDTWYDEPPVIPATTRAFKMVSRGPDPKNNHCAVAIDSLMPGPPQRPLLQPAWQHMLVAPVRGGVK